MYLRHLRKFISLLLLTTSVFASIQACQCPKAVYKFIHRLKKAEFVGYVEVIGYDTAKSHVFDQTFTVLKILKQFQGKSLGETITVLDGGDVGCTHTLSYPIGTRFIIKARVESRKWYEYNWEDTPLPEMSNEIKDPVLVLSICSETIIEVKNDKAIGYLTIDRMKSKQPQEVEIRYAILMIEQKARPQKKIPLT